MFSSTSWKFIGLLLPLAFLLNSCSPNTFSAEDDNSGLTATVTTTSPGGGGGGGTISCTPKMNGSTGSLSLTVGSSSNPTATANCSPAAVTYAWNVTRGGTPVTINGLTGASSTPDFLAAGAGTYKVSLTATAVGYTTYTSPSPITVTVSAGAGLPSVSCSPNINGNVTTISLSSTNPTINANCNPATAGYVWTVKNGGNTVIVSGLIGSSSTPNFLSLAPGTYLVYLSATLTGYNPYTSSSPLSVTVPAATPTNVNTTINVNTSNKLDILVVLDDSGSMLSDNQKLAARLKGFVDSLGSVDWQMCATITQAQQISSSNPNYYWGASENWVGNPNSTGWILKAGTANLDTIFANTIQAVGAGWAGSDDERAIKAAWWHIYNGDPRYSGNSGCYRAGANVAVIIISDEDERSVGGDQTQVYYSSEANLPLELDDLPQTYIDYVSQVFGAGKGLTVSSIIVRPNDTTCMAQEDASGNKSHYGVHYNQLSQLTHGSVGSICDADYSPNLSFILASVKQSLSSVTLQCSPLNNAINDTINPSFTTTASLNTNMLSFNPSIPNGSTVTLSYQCPH